MEEFLRVCHAIQPLSAALEATLRQLVRQEPLAAGQHLLVSGQTAQRLYFLEAGLVRGFYLKDGKEVTSWFMQEVTS